MEKSVSVNLPHHIKRDLCTTRPAYRQGRRYTSVKVYTINNESQHLLIYNVPAIGIDAELHSLCQRFGEVIFSKQVICNDDIEEFTNVFHIQYGTMRSSRFAKRNLDNKSFFGGVLHVCYAPELETVEETKNKLITRRKEVSFHLKQLEFPKQFRYEGKNKGKKRKFEENARSNPHFSYHNLKQISQPMEEQIPGPSRKKSQEEIHKKTLPLDTQPFKKLIPTKVSRIIFYNKKEDKDKTETLPI